MDDYGQGKGYFAETLALQGLVRSDIHIPYEWMEGNAEVEFLIVHQGEIIPVEVKSSSYTRSKSLCSYINRYSPKAVVKLHAGRCGYDSQKRLHSLPLYLAWDLTKMDLLG